MEDKTEFVVCQSNDREIWRKVPGDFYSPSIHVTEGGGIGIACGGHVIVAPVEKWHAAGDVFLCVNTGLSEWRYRLGMWLIKSCCHEHCKP